MLFHIVIVDVSGGGGIPGYPSPCINQCWGSVAYVLSLHRDHVRVC